jgi:hypothetical protein
MATITTASAGNLLTDANWVGGVAPTASDDAVIAHAMTLTNGQSVTYATVTFNSGGLITHSGTCSLTATSVTSAIAANAFLHNGGAFTLTANVTYTGTSTSGMINTLSVGRFIVINGNLDNQSSGFLMTGPAGMTVNGNCSNSGSGRCINSNTTVALPISGSVTNTGTGICVAVNDSPGPVVSGSVTATAGTAVNLSAVSDGQIGNVNIDGNGGTAVNVFRSLLRYSGASIQGRNANGRGITAGTTTLGCSGVVLTNPNVVIESSNTGVALNITGTNVVLVYLDSATITGSQNYGILRFNSPSAANVRNETTYWAGTATGTMAAGGIPVSRIIGGV